MGLARSKVERLCFATRLVLLLLLLLLGDSASMDIDRGRLTRTRHHGNVRTTCDREQQSMQTGRAGRMN